MRAAGLAVTSLGHELIGLQAGNAEFAAALETAGTRGELAEVKRRLEAHQALLGSWEEKVGSRGGAVAGGSARGSLLRAGGCRALAGGILGMSGHVAWELIPRPAPPPPPPRCGASWRQSQSCRAHRAATACWRSQAALRGAAPMAAS